MMINYAHRGACAYYPENTLSSFYAGFDMGADGIETDVHVTKDGVVVLMHDDTLDRVTDGTGKVVDYTYEELLKFNVLNKEYGRVDKITTLEDLLKYFGWRDITFAIELKPEGVDIEKPVIDLLEKYNMREKVYLTSFVFDNLVKAKQYAPEYRVGYLYTPAEEHALEKIKSIGGEQLCPQAKILTPEMVEECHALGYTVRAWGVNDEEIMAHVVRCGGDGMTVNFPDKLTRLLKGCE